MHRYELSDRQWARIAPLFPRRARAGGVGRPPADHRPIVSDILWVLHTGAPWRDLPERYGVPPRLLLKYPLRNKVSGPERGRVRTGRTV
jgi:transposase